MEYAVYNYKRDRSRWNPVERFKPGDAVWEFSEDGKLYSRHTGEKYYTTGYYYLETSKLLVIDLAYYKALGYTRFRLMDFYRMDAVNPDEVWLYVVNGMMDKPQDYREAYKLLRCKQ